MRQESHLEHDAVVTVEHPHDLAILGVQHDDTAVPEADCDTLGRGRDIEAGRT